VKGEVKVTVGKQHRDVEDLIDTNRGLKELKESRRENKSV